MSVLSDWLSRDSANSVILRPGYSVIVQLISPKAYGHHAK